MSALVRVVTGEEAAARDRSAIAAGTPSAALMERAGVAAANEIARRYPDRLAHGVVCFAGPGNNGGDAWVVARALAARGARVRVVEVAEPRSTDARAARESALTHVGRSALGTAGDEAVVVDGVLGTGASGEPRGAAAAAIRAVQDARERGATIVALDVPSGVDATAGAATLAVTAHLTLSFGTAKRGQLVARERCGRLVVLDIGLGAHAEGTDGAPQLVDDHWVETRLPRIPATAHKGVRKKLAIVGGAKGMAGAAVLAARGAFRSGIGMVRLLVAPESLAAVQAAEPAAMAAPWPASARDVDEPIIQWADAVVIGPGLGRGDAARGLVERVLGSWRGPVVLDADALTTFAGDLDALSALCAGRSAVLTPHPGELAAMTGSTTAEVLAQRFDAGARLAQQVGAIVLLKGVPTVVSVWGERRSPRRQSSSAPAARRYVVAAGTAALAAAGSGDILSGIAGTLVAQGDDPVSAAAMAAWAHGRAAEIAGGLVFGDEADEPRIRGITLDDVLDALGRVWSVPPRALPPPILAELPPAGEAS